MSAYVNKITEPLLFQSYVILCLISFCLCCVIITSVRYGFSRRSAYDAAAVQSAHTGFVPRVGGLAIYLSILSFLPLSTFGFIPISIFLDLDIFDMSLLLFSATPVFLAGLSEDLGYRVSPKSRLLSSVVSGLLVVVIFNEWITSLGIPGLDLIISFAPVGIAFTVFATSGVVNAFNLIDGINGLSSYITISTAIALSLVAFKAEFTQISLFLILLSSAVSGFMLLNFPMGKIFLGDGGAYLLGHLLVWSAVILVGFDLRVSPFAVLLLFFWPVADTGLAIWRRLSLGKPADRPDRLHFHQLAMRYLEIRIFGREKRHLANPLATVILIPLISAPQILGVLYWNNHLVAVCISFTMVFVFISTYLTGVKLAKKR